jgi:PIN domain nuclease of toxin-antitoxin system
LVGIVAEADGWTCLTLTPGVLAAVHGLPPPKRRDPTGQVRIATARLKRRRIVTTDGRIATYPHVMTVP